MSDQTQEDATAMALAESAPVTPESIRALITLEKAHTTSGTRPHSARRNLVRIIYELIDNGPAKASSGRATGVLRERLTARGDIEVIQGRGNSDSLTGLSATLRELEQGGLVSRVVKGKRTLEIRAAVDAAMLEAAGFDRGYPDREAPTGSRYREGPRRYLNGQGPALQVVPHVEPEPEPEPEPEQASAPADADAGLLVVPDDVRVTDTYTPVGYLIEASRLIAEAVVHWASPDDQVAARLADVLEDNERLRRRVRVAEDTCVGLKSERDGLRRAKALLEQNLSAMAKGAFNPEQYRRFKELDHLVRTAPTSARGQ